MMITSDFLLENVPDFTDWNTAKAWIQTGIAKAREFKASFDTTSLEWKDIQVPRSPFFGLHSSKKWQQFVLAAYLADLACYSTPVDQVQFDRLLLVMHLFPQGFRVGWARCEDGTWWPVGYTAWYPVLEHIFEIFEKTPARIKDRTVVPEASLKKNATHPFLYLFNYSVAPHFRGSAFSKALMKLYAQDLHSQNYQGLLAITVSNDGKRVAKRFGMSCSGSFSIENTEEDVYVGRYEAK